MEGPDKFQRFVVIEFPTFEQGVACFTSEEYNKAAAFRRNGAGEVETVIVESIGRVSRRRHDLRCLRKARASKDAVLWRKRHQYGRSTLTIGHWGNGFLRERTA